MTNLQVNFFPFLKNRPIKICKLRAIRARRTFSRIRRFLKFNHFFTIWFFVFKKWTNIFKDWKQRRARKSPKHLISTIMNMGFVKKMELATKTLSCPVKERRFGIVTLKLNSIAWICAVFMHCSSHIQAAFSINETSKVSKIICSSCYSIPNAFKFFFNRVVDKKRYILQGIHSIQYKVPVILENGIQKLLKNLAFFLLFNKKRENVIQRIQSIFVKNKMIGRESVFLTANFCMDRTIKFGFKPFDIFKIGGYNRKGVLIKWRCFDFSNEKTSVPIYVASCVSKICFIHTA